MLHLHSKPLCGRLGEERIWVKGAHLGLQPVLQTELIPNPGSCCVTLGKSLPHLWALSSVDNDACLVVVWRKWKKMLRGVCPAWYLKVLVVQFCPTNWDPVDWSPPGFSVHEILQARILEWVAIPFSMGSSKPRDRTGVSCTAGRFFTV